MEIEKNDVNLSFNNYLSKVNSLIMSHVPKKKLNKQQQKFFFFFFFNYYLAAPRPTSGHYRGDSLTHPMLITAFVHVRPEGHREPRSEVGSLSPAERLAGFELGTRSHGLLQLYKTLFRKRTIFLKKCHVKILLLKMI